MFGSLGEGNDDDQRALEAQRAIEETTPAGQEVHTPGSKAHQRKERKRTVC